MAFLLISAALLLVSFLLIDTLLRMTQYPIIVSLWQYVFFLFFGVFLHRTLLREQEEKTTSTPPPTTTTSTTKGQTTSTTKGQRKRISTADNNDSNSTVGAHTNQHQVPPILRASSAPVAMTSSSSSSSTPPVLPLAAQAVMDDILQRRFTSSTTTVVNFAPFEMVFPYPFEEVCTALKHKYRPPNDPQNPTVREVRVVSEEDVTIMSEQIITSSSSSSSSTSSIRPIVKGILDGSRITVRAREIVAGLKEWIPSYMRWLISVDCVIIEEETIFYPQQRMLRNTIKNRDLTTIGRIQDQSLYRASEVNPNWTVYSAWLDLEGVNSVGAKFVGLYSVKPGQPAPSSASLIKGHLTCMDLRLKEYCGTPS